jgi:hypothetical protein
MDSNTVELKTTSEKKPEIKKTLCVNLYGGPGTGKSVQQALVFARLKIWGVDAMMSMEIAKRHVYSGSKDIATQEGLFGDQLKELNLFNNHVEVIVSEAPLLFSIIYDKAYSETDNIDFYRNVSTKYKQFDNMEFLLTRAHEYRQEGRYQDEQGAKDVDKIIRTVLKDNGVSPVEIAPYEESAITIARMVMERLGKTAPV